MKNFQKYEKQLLKVGISTLLITVFISLTDIDFAVTEKGSSFSSLWLLISETGIKTGTILSVLVVSFIIAFRQKSVLQAVTKFIAFAVFVLLALQLFATINAKFTKPMFHLYRPSFQKLTALEVINIDELYAFNSHQERKEYLLKKLQQPNIQSQISNIDKHILEHWLESTGFSFPSGHSQNAFLLATFLSFALLQILKNKKWQYVAFAPMIWASLVALSRVILGVHTSLDIFVGAVSGFLVAYAIILTGYIQWASSVD